MFQAKNFVNLSRMRLFSGKIPIMFNFYFVPWFIIIEGVVRCQTGEIQISRMHLFYAYKYGTYDVCGTLNKLLARNPQELKQDHRLIPTGFASQDCKTLADMVKHLRATFRASYCLRY